MCQSLQGFSYLLTTEKFKEEVYSLVCQSLQGFSYLLTCDSNCGNEYCSWCQSLQGFSYLLTQLVQFHLVLGYVVSIPSRVLISSNCPCNPAIYLCSYTTLRGRFIFLCIFPSLHMPKCLSAQYSCYARLISPNILQSCFQCPLI